MKIGKASSERIDERLEAVGHVGRERVEVVEMRPARTQVFRGVGEGRPWDERPQVAGSSLGTLMEGLSFEGAAQPECRMFDVALDEHGAGLGGFEEHVEGRLEGIVVLGIEEDRRKRGQGVLESHTVFATVGFTVDDAHHHAGDADEGESEDRVGDDGEDERCPLAHRGERDDVGDQRPEPDGCVDGDPCCEERFQEDDRGEADVRVEHPECGVLESGESHGEEDRSDVDDEERKRRVVVFCPPAVRGVHHREQGEGSDDVAGGPSDEGGETHGRNRQSRGEGDVVSQPHPGDALALWLAQ